MFTIDLKNDITNAALWESFQDYFYKKYSLKLNTKNERYYLDFELKQYKATLVTDWMSYSKLVFDDKKNFTMFCLRFV